MKQSIKQRNKNHSPWFVTAQSQEHFDSFLNPDDCCCSVSNLLHHCKTATITKLACLFFFICLATFVHWEMMFNQGETIIIYFRCWNIS